MEFHRRRGRKGRGHSYATVTIPDHSYYEEESPRSWKFTHSITSFLILSSLIGIIYLVMDNHCYSCGLRHDNRNLTNSISQIEHNLIAMKNNYDHLQIQLSNFNEKLPKLEDQINILEALANTKVQREYGWDPKLLSNLPNLDMLLNKVLMENKWNNSTQELTAKTKPTNSAIVKPIKVNRTRIKLLKINNEI